MYYRSGRRGYGGYRRGFGWPWGRPLIIPVTSAPYRGSARGPAQGSAQGPAQGSAEGPAQGSPQGPYQDPVYYEAGYSWRAFAIVFSVIVVVLCLTLVPALLITRRMYHHGYHHHYYKSEEPSDGIFAGFKNYPWIVVAVWYFFNFGEALFAVILSQS